MLGPEIILASKSAARIEMLRRAGLKFESVPAGINEREIAKFFSHAGEIAHELAKRKALNVAIKFPGALVIGSDQVLACEEKILSKANTKEEAADKLRFLRGKSHRLISSVAIAQDDKIIWSDTDEAVLKMKNFDDKFLNSYIQSAGDSVTSCVGAYAYEEKGAWLFEKVRGDYFTILGMPLYGLLDFLHHQGVRP